MKKGATLSADRIYRHALYREWDANLQYVMFIGLNPSTADESEDDPTIRRCIRFAKDWGFGGIFMTNLFDYRATNPKDLFKVDHPVSVYNDSFLESIAFGAGRIICAWGANGGYLNRDDAVMDLLSQYKMDCLKITKNGHPGHPLYIKADTIPRAFLKGLI